MNKTVVKKIIVEQKQEISRILRKSFVEREKEALLRESLSDDLIKIVTGVRRSGKSSLIHRVLKDKRYGYLNFDDERLRKVEVDKLDSILEILHEVEGDISILFFDEIQNVKGWELFVSRLRRQGYTIFVTGSNSKLLSRELATHLTGRHFSLELYPFSFKEHLRFKEIGIEQDDLITTKGRAKLQNELEEYLNKGGFPESLSVAQPQTYLRELYTKIILQDIVGRYNLKHKETLKDIAHYLLGNFATRQTYHKIRNVFEISSVHTIKNYLGYLEEAYLIFQLIGFSAKQKESLRGPKKIYGIDQGLIRAVESGMSENIGRFIENLVFIELKRRDKNVFYYMDYSGWEVDFVLKKGSKITNLIQVVYNLNNVELRNREFRSLLKSSNKFNCDKLQVVVYYGERENKIIKGKKIEIIPLLDWLLDK